MSADYHKSKRIALKTIIILGIVTLVEVMIALTGKGYIIDGVEFPIWAMSLVMICMSLFKAFLIVGEFMHMKHEVKAFAMTVLLPMTLLIWAIIAFMYEGWAWKDNRNTIEERNELEVKSSVQLQGMLLEDDVKYIR